MSYFDENDRKQAARLLFDAITDLEAEMVASVGSDESTPALCAGISLGKVCAARHYLAATLSMPVVAPEEASDRLRGHTSLESDNDLRAFMVRKGFDPNSALDVETARAAFMKPELRQAAE